MVSERTISDASQCEKILKYSTPGQLSCLPIGDQSRSPTPRTGPSLLNEPLAEPIRNQKSIVVTQIDMTHAFGAMSHKQIWSVTPNQEHGELKVGLIWDGWSRS
jgi:hypothetical protein